MPDRLLLRRPDDWHLHLRDGAMMQAVLPHSAARFGRALVMPNLVPPVRTAADARAYRQRILAALPHDTRFAPFMTLYLTEDTDPDEVALAHASGAALAVKLYPAGATTNSHAGVRDLDAVRPVLERMAEIGMPLCIHGEATDPDVDIFDREAVFIDRVLRPLRRRVPDLRIVLEHVTTQDGVDFVRDTPRHLAATITAHHLVLNRNALLAGGIRPHLYCNPVAKRERHRLALVEAAVSGDRRFFLGTDSAPHPDSAKLSPCGCAGLFTAPVALSVCAAIFEAARQLPRLEAFVSLNGAAFYGMAPSADRIALVRGEAWSPPAAIPCGEDRVTVFDPGFPLHWRVEESA
ncbi:dihydroorotase [Rubellimicrobium sp. CFH 75288]|uniref:dihydroorotase n=1 Tax=Rubellimicrobium sp. CFH 75288 TaxID=2697034 RepID=UPI0014125175|nr:dihydroorotase [Rubellimicrobium sp. CFH 75288]NAZ35591.1 dihydroorotase [Rubellimicrobium sp. CFH 75288]